MNLVVIWSQQNMTGGEERFNESLNQSINDSMLPVASRRWRLISKKSSISSSPSRVRLMSQAVAEGWGLVGSALRVFEAGQTSRAAWR